MDKKYKILILLLILIIPLSIIFITNSKNNKVNISGGILQEGVIPGYTAVSYTHLDVYKRQQQY